MKKRILIALMSVFALSASAQTWGELYGVVLDERGQPMPNAYVTAAAGEKQIMAATDLDGQYRIKPLNPGTYTLKVTYAGFHDYTLTRVLVKPDQSTMMEEIRMTDSTVELGGAEVFEYKRPLINPEETNKIITLAADLKNSPAKRDIKSIVAASTAEIKVDPVTQELYFRGARGNSVQYIIDGMKVNGAFGGIPASGIGSVSVYTGGVPAKYGDFTGGVIIIESKNYFDLYNDWFYAQK
ncbi:MAG: hypothetical protein ACI923_000695 [Flavobacteriales bacterium]|jgi:hypothetical protein